MNDRSNISPIRPCSMNVSNFKPIIWYCILKDRPNISPIRLCLWNLSYFSIDCIAQMKTVWNGQNPNYWIRKVRSSWKDCQYKNTFVEKVVQLIHSKFDVLRLRPIGKESGIILGRQIVLTAFFFRKERL